MRYQTFGRLTGLRVSEFALGTANFSTSDAGAGPEGSREIFEGFVAICSSYSQQLAIREDVDPKPFRIALVAVINQ